MSQTPNAGHGGYRRPTNPAPVSGPGALSQRTDGGPTDMLASGGPYGSRQDMQQLQSSADMLAPGDHSALTPYAPAAPDVSALTHPTAPTQRPNEPVTSGIGQVANTTGVPNTNTAPGLDAQTHASILAALPVLTRAAASPQADAALRNFVNSARAAL